MLFVSGQVRTYRLGSVTHIYYIKKIDANHAVINCRTHYVSVRTYINRCYSSSTAVQQYSSVQETVHPLGGVAAMPRTFRTSRERRKAASRAPGHGLFRPQHGGGGATKGGEIVLSVCHFRICILKLVRWPLSRSVWVAFRSSFGFRKPFFRFLFCFAFFEKNELGVTGATSLTFGRFSNLSRDPETHVSLCL